MEDSAPTLLPGLLRDIPDQREPGNIVHQLHDMLVITVCAVIGDGRTSVLEVTLDPTGWERDHGQDGHTANILQAQTRRLFFEAVVFHFLI